VGFQGDGGAAVISEHYAAVKALLPATVNVHMWNVPTSPVYPYVVLWGDLGDESSGGPDGESLQDVPEVLTLRIRATYAGLTGDSLSIVCKNVRAALNRKTPVVAGWMPSRLKQATLMDAQTDFDVTIPNIGHPIFAVDEFSLVSEKS
jgi:hypothetical protein